MSGLCFKVIAVTSFFQNCSILWCDETKECVVIDPGGELERIEAVLSENYLKVTKVLLTHGHIDHVGGAKTLAEHHKAPIEGPHPADQFCFDKLLEQVSFFGFEQHDPLLEGPNRFLDTGDTIVFGQQSLSVFHTPGHTPGHIIFVSKENKLAWVGDFVFAGGGGRTDLPQGSFEQLIDSIKTHICPLDDDIRLIPGHGALSTVGHEKKTNPFLKGLHV